MGLLLANNATSMLAAPILAADTILLVAAADAALFPQPAVTGDYFYLTIEDRRVVPNLREIVKVTARSANACTIVRAQESTTAQPFFAGAVVGLRLTAASLAALGADEAAARAAAITAEATARATADADETARAIAVEAAEIMARSTAITNEQTTRAAADTAEAAARLAADNAETVARNAAVAAVLAAVTAESTRAQASELVLYGDVSTLQAADVADNTWLLAAINTETTRALAAEAAVAAALAGGSARGGSGSVVVGSTTAVSFSPAYPTAVAAVLVNKTSSDPYGEGILVTVKSTTGFTVGTTTNTSGSIGTGMTFDWIAAGT